MVVMASSMFVYLISFVNQLLIAKKFGTGARLDAYFAATNIPLAVNNLLAACFVYAVVPSLVRDCLEKENRKHLLAGLLQALTYLALLFVILAATIPGMMSGYWAQFGPYANEARLSAEVAWITSGVFCLTALSDSVYNATGKFQFPVLAYLPAYVLTALACLLFSDAHGGVALAISTLIGYLVVWPKRIWDQRNETQSPVDYEYAKSTARQVPFMLLAVGSLYGFPIVDSLLGPTAGEGVVSILGMSSRLVSTLAVILAVGPFGVAIPALSALSRDGNRAEFARRSLHYVRVAMTALALIVGWLMAVRTPVIQLLFQREKFSAHSTAQLSELMLFTIPGALFMICSMLLVRLMAADGRLAEAAKIGLLGVVGYGVAFALLKQFGPWGIGLANGIAWLTYFIAVLWLFVLPFKSYISKVDQVSFGLKLIGGIFGAAAVSVLTDRIVGGQKILSPMFSLMTSSVCFGVYASLVKLDEFGTIARPLVSRLRSSRIKASNNQ